MSKLRYSIDLTIKRKDDAYRQRMDTDVVIVSLHSDDTATELKKLLRNVITSIDVAETIEAPAPEGR